jgi:hypothetical protein
MKNDILIEKIGDRNIAIKGIGRLFYESGFPISFSISELKKKGIEVSILHVVDELIRNGWSTKTILNRITADFEDDIDNNIIDIDSIITFFNSTYENQREMIFNYLFKTKEEAKDFFKQKIQYESS